MKSTTCRASRQMSRGGLRTLFLFIAVLQFAMGWRVEFTLAGMKFIALNGGPAFAFTEAVSFQIETEDQAETDRLWEALIADGGSESQCGWLKDRWGMSWQITPRQLTALFLGADKAAAQRAGQAMFSMRKIDIATIEAAARGEAADA